MTPSDHSREPTTALMLAAGCWALVLGWLSTRQGDYYSLPFHLALWVPLFALLWRLGRRGVEASWRLMGLGIVLFGLGDAAWDIIHATGQRSDASWADMVYLAGYVSLAVGMAVLLRKHGGPERRNGLVDGALVAVPTLVLMAEFLVVPGDDASQSLIVRVVMASYPLADALLVAGLVWLLVTPGLPRRVVVPLAVGMVTLLGLDVLWAAGLLLGDGAINDTVNGFFPIAYVLLACGVALGASRPMGQIAPVPSAALPWGRVVLLGVGLMSAPLAAVIGVVSDRLLLPVVVVIATVVVASLVVLRFLGLVKTLNQTTEELTRARNELREQAVRDPLTGVYNRLILPEQLAVLGSGTGGPAALLSIDLDHFKRVNDDHGHQAGDVVLEAVAERLRQNVRSRDAVIRMGGDEFLVVLWDVAGSRAMELASRIVGAIEAPIPYGDGNLRVSASVGIALVGGGTPGIDTEEILREADVAMYEAKRSGPGLFHLSTH